MKVKVLRSKLVKPCKPTPPHLYSYKLCILDEINPAIHNPRILYFSCSGGGGIEEKLVSLEESLAQILSNFYPLAGTYNLEKRQVDCNDQGARFSTADADCTLSQIIGADVAPEQLNSLLPLDVLIVDESVGPILAVQVNMFSCGGLAIGICAAHRVVDSTSFGLFVTSWAKAAASGGVLLPRPHFDANNYFPAEHLTPLDSHHDHKLVTRRYFFDSRAIERLRVRLSGEWKSLASTSRPPSRVVAVSSFLTQAVLRADRIQHGKPRASVIGQLIDIRERTVPPVPKHTFGTWLSGCFLELSAAETQGHGYGALAAKMHCVLRQGVRDCARVLLDKEFGRKQMVDNFVEAAEKDDCKLIWVTDLSKCGEYEADFGFGKPEYVSLVAMPLQDHIMLINNRSNDGMEAWVCLAESDMQFLQPIMDIPIFNSSL